MTSVQRHDNDRLFYIIDDCYLSRMDILQDNVFVFKNLLVKHACSGSML